MTPGWHPVKHPTNDTGISLGIRTSGHQVVLCDGAVVQDCVTPVTVPLPVFWSFTTLQTLKEIVWTFLCFIGLTSLYLLCSKLFTTIVISTHPDPRNGKWEENPYRPLKVLFFYCFLCSICPRGPFLIEIISHTPPSTPLHPEGVPPCNCNLNKNKNTSIILLRHENNTPLRKGSRYLSITIHLT